MIAQYARQEEVWVPCSDWGRAQKIRNEEYLRNAVTVIRQPKRVGRKVLADTALRERKFCRLCPNQLSSRNESGVCTSCHEKTRGKGPRPLCSECKQEMNRTVKGGDRPSTVCYACTRKAKKRKVVTPEELERRRQERLRKAREAYNRISPIRYCHCGRQLQANNKSGLCIEHNGMAGQASYRARRKKAA